MISFDYSNFKIDITPFLVHIKELLHFFVNACYLEVLLYSSPLQSSTCTTYSKYPPESVMVVLTPKLGISKALSQ